MIATNEADVLRHGWQDAASTLAADIPEVGELLQARLEMAIASRRLDERHLLDTIEEVESISSRAGNPASDALALRLRRTVYEFLLALDAIRQTENTAPAEEPTVSGTMVGVEEVAALGHPTLLRGPAAQVSPDEASGANPTDSEPNDASALAPDVNLDDGEAGSATATGRRFSLVSNEHDDVDATAEDADGALGTILDEPVTTGAAVGDASDTETAPADSAPGDPSATAFMAPRAGFHIGDDGIVVPGAGGGDDAPLTMPVFAADEMAATATEEQLPGSAPGSAGVADTDENSEFLTWRHATRDSDTAPLAGPDVAEVEASPPLETAPATVARTAHQPAGTSAAPAGDEDDEERGWRVRRPGEAHVPRAVPAPQPEEDPFEGNAKLTETRRRIEDRLRRKRCDEAAALLQALALETGGRHVAELAMNAGDRCRALGKSNAALNCYLAASRSDPVYELPLSRLADICIDDKETDLAVSYLERIARLYRFRGDEVAALRVYRRIATIAPYREDVLSMLMNAQRTGRLEA